MKIRANTRNKVKTTWPVGKPGGFWFLHDLTTTHNGYIFPLFILTFVSITLIDGGFQVTNHTDGFYLFKHSFS